MTAPADAGLLAALEPEAARLLDRHLGTAREWLPHEWVPWSRGRDFVGAGGTAWSPEQSPLGEAVRAALALNLLTEDNLPSYHHELASRFHGSAPWAAWARRWTAEEARHATALRDYVHLSRALDPTALERDRMAAVEAGWSAGGKGLLRCLVFATLQELATRIAHRNTGRASGDAVADRLLARIAADEHLHMVFYRDLVSAALAIAPDATVIAIAQEAAAFEMPGAGIPGFLRCSVLMADAGIYDAGIHRDEVLRPLLQHWQAASLPVATPAAREAQAGLSEHVDRLDALATRQRERRARRAARQAPGVRP